MHEVIKSNKSKEIPISCSFVTPVGVTMVTLVRCPIYMFSGGFEPHMLWAGWYNTLCVCIITVTGLPGYLGYQGCHGHCVHLDSHLLET